jgi:DNA-binding CsgD family transcriptional regulator
VARRDLDRFRGRPIDVSGDRVVATFDGPARAIRCAEAIAGAARDLGLSTRAGLHTGECELRDERISGVAVPLAAWVAAQAAPNEILVSSTVKDLVAGAGLQFADRGPRTLTGVPGEWRLFAVLPDAAEQSAPTASVLPPPGSPHADLTPREREVLQLVARGLSNREIAAALSVSERTAESHVASILAKRGMTSRGQLAAAYSHIEAPNQS